MSIKPAFQWRSPSLLLALGLLNIASGAFQLFTINAGPVPVDPADMMASPQYFETPLPIVLHIVCGIIFNLLAPWQFAPVIRQRWPKWHRLSGRFLVVCGLIAAFTALWMNQFFPVFGGTYKYIGVLVMSAGLIVSLIFAVLAIRERDISRHRIWMMCAIAFALAPATQRLIGLPIFLILQEINVPFVVFLIWSSLVVNLGFVWILVRRQRSMLAANRIAV